MPSRSWFSKALLPWYTENKRDLPWRNSADPYRIWLSEVILQQTRVDQGLEYWKRFVRRWPSVADLAAASEDEVLKEWQGLGYYSRARNLRAGALQVIREHEGDFPRSHTGLLKLKGVGDYTAAAIASICFNQAEAVVDGNVYRVLSRVFGIATPIDSSEGRRAFKMLAGELISKEQPGDHNQAVMELGATVCTPRNPNCIACPLMGRCIAQKEGRIALLPVKSKKQVVRIRHFNYLVIRSAKGLWMRQRKGKDIWQGLWELPMLETERSATSSALLNLISKSLGKSAGTWSVKKTSLPVEHLLSHQRIIATYWVCEPVGKWRSPDEWKMVSPKELKKLAVHRLMERWMEKA